MIAQVSTGKHVLLEINGDEVVFGVDGDIPRRIPGGAQATIRAVAMTRKDLAMIRNKIIAVMDETEVPQETEAPPPPEKTEEAESPDLREQGAQAEEYDQEIAGEPTLGEALGVDVNDGPPEDIEAEPAKRGRKKKE